MESGPGAEDVDDDERMEHVVEVTDGLLERVDAAMDSISAAAAGSAAPGEAMKTAAATNVAVSHRRVNGSNLSDPAARQTCVPPSAF
jgi:hypothetical protein